MKMMRISDLRVAIQPASNSIDRCISRSITVFLRGYVTINVTLGYCLANSPCARNLGYDPSRAKSEVG
jgi:hypothetical protein